MNDDTFTPPADLKAALAWSEKQLETFRRQRKEVLAAYAGPHYGSGASTDKIPIPLIQTYAGIYSRHVAVNDPQVLITSPYSELAASAAEYRLAVNEKLQQLNVEVPFNDAGLEALLLMGCIIVGIDENGEPVVESIPFDDLIVDMSAKNWRQVGYVGHHFRPTLAWVQSNEAFDPEVRKKLTGDERFGANTFSGNSNDAQSQTVALGATRNVEELEKCCNLTQLYLVESGYKIIFADGDPNKLLHKTKWTGPPGVQSDASRVGMYHYLSYNTVPGNLLPIAPAQLWRDISDSVNRLANKSIRQAERQKTLLVGGNADDMQAITDASDGQAISVTDNPDKIVEKSTGGADQRTLGMVPWLRNIGNYVAGNPEMIGGLAPTTDTVGQDQLLSQGATTQVKQMQHRMLAFARSVLADVAWWMWTDPISSPQVSRPIPGTNEHLPFTWDASRRKGDFKQYRFDIEPYSIKRRTPEEKLSTLLSLVDRFSMQYGQQMAAAQMQFDMEKLTKIVADYANMPEFSSIIVYGSGQQLDQVGGESGPGRPVVPPRQPAPQGGGANPLADMESSMMSKMMSAPGGAQ